MSSKPQKPAMPARPEGFKKTEAERMVLINALIGVAQGTAQLLNGCRNYVREEEWIVVVEGIETALGAVGDEPALYLLEEPVERAQFKEHLRYVLEKQIAELRTGNGEDQP